MWLHLAKFWFHSRTARCDWKSATKNAVAQLSKVPCARDILESWCGSRRLLILAQEILAEIFLLPLNISPAKHKGASNLPNFLSEPGFLIACIGTGSDSTCRTGFHYGFQQMLFLARAGALSALVGSVVWLVFHPVAIRSYPSTVLLGTGWLPFCHKLWL